MVSFLLLWWFSLPRPLDRPAQGGRPSIPPVQGAASRTFTLPQNEDFAITRFRGKNGPCPQG